MHGNDSFSTNNNSQNSQNATRNFCIIAHIDHGKTSLTDQLLKKTGTVSSQETIERILDSNPIEKERGITIKLAPVTMSYTLPESLKNVFNIKICTLNLIDTPGHVDFSYEVSRSLAACEAAILLVDATQGIQAQTLAHAQRAIDLGLTLLPAINKIDLRTARIDAVASQLKKIFGFKRKEISLISAKTGEGVTKLLSRIIKQLPKPEGKRQKPLRILVFNSIYDSHLGVIAFVRVVDGKLTNQSKLISIAGGKKIEIKEVGIFTPSRTRLNVLSTGDVGYIATGLKDIRVLKVGDTLTDETFKENLPSPLPGFQIPKPVIFADVYPSKETKFNELKEAIEKLRLTDSSLIVKHIHSQALGGGYRLGFLGLFHTEITRERLKREHLVNTILTKPTVEYLVETKEGSQLTVQHPSELPDSTQILKTSEPMIETVVFAPRLYLGQIMQLIQDRRGTYKDTLYIGKEVQLIYNLPLSELISGFVDELKSISQGFASLDYKHIEPQPVTVVKLTILINKQEVESLSRIIVSEQSQKTAKQIVAKLKEILPRQLFAVPIQAAIGGKIIARETKPAARKDVTAKLYGGDRTRRMKLLEKQKKGKKKLAQLGRVSIPPETFTELMKI
jgi:GTP-binding protein LepA